MNPETIALGKSKIQQLKMDEFLQLMETLPSDDQGVMLYELAELSPEIREPFTQKAIKQQIFTNPFVDDTGDSLLNRVCRGAIVQNFDNLQYLTRLLIEGGAPINFLGYKRKTPLVNSLENNMQNIETLLKYKAEVFHTGRNGVAVLFAAATYSRSQNIELILQAGAPINAQDTHGQTALMIATILGKEEQVRCLLQNGADIHMKDEDGYTAIGILQENLNTRKEAQWFKNLHILENHLLHLELQSHIQHKNLPPSPPKNKL